MYDIETKNLVKKYGELTAVNNVNLLVEEKSLFGLLGVNGAGKTTLIKMLTCLSVPTSGKAFVGGFEISENPDKIKEITDVSPQETAVAPNLTVGENLRFFAEIYGITDEKYINNITYAKHLGFAYVKYECPKVNSKNSSINKANLGLPWWFSG